MKRGKRICNQLKEIRKRIATEYNLDYTPTECTHKGDCLGTCPLCDAEVEELQRQLTAKGITDIDLTVPIDAILEDTSNNNHKLLKKRRTMGYIVRPKRRLLTEEHLNRMGEYVNFIPIGETSFRYPYRILELNDEEYAKFKRNIDELGYYYTRRIVYKPKETVYKRLEPGEIIVFLHRGDSYDEICRMEIVACSDDNVSNYLRDKDKEYMHDIEDDCTFFVLKLRSEIKTLNKSDLEFLNNEPINTFDLEECISPWASNQIDKLLKL